MRPQAAAKGVLVININQCGPKQDSHRCLYAELLHGVLLKNSKAISIYRPKLVASKVFSLLIGQPSHVTY